MFGLFHVYVAWVLSLCVLIKIVTCADCLSRFVFSVVVVVVVGCLECVIAFNLCLLLLCLSYVYYCMFLVLYYYCRLLLFVVCLCVLFVMQFVFLCVSLFAPLL